MIGDVLSLGLRVYNLFGPRDVPKVTVSKNIGCGVLLAELCLTKGGVTVL